MRSPITGRNSPKSSNCWRRSWTELRRSKHTRFPTQPFTRSPLTSQRDDDNFCSTLRFDGVVSTGGELGLAPAFVHSKNCGAPNCFHFSIVHYLVLCYINTVTYNFGRSDLPFCYAGAGRALFCHAKARMRSSSPSKNETSWNGAPISIRYRIVLSLAPR